MPPFDAYAAYYDLLYRDKAYKEEARYVGAIVRETAPGAKTLLDLGCGTGKHAGAFAERGYAITGVDRSESMIATAASENPALSFVLGDVRNISLDQRFDAVVSLFHVMSYMPENGDVLALLGTARRHLKDRGVFVFDCWYGPAVLTEQPETRVKKVSDENAEVIRIAEPVMDANANTVDVRYTVFVREKGSDRMQVIEESHLMRYFFLPEIRSFLDRAGFTFLKANAWMTDAPPGFGTWNIVVAARK